MWKRNNFIYSNIPRMETTTGINDTDVNVTLNNSNLEHEVEKKESETTVTFSDIDTKTIESDERFKEIDNLFKESKDFAEMGEKLTAPIDEIISRSNELIENDPVIWIGNELSKINKEVNEVYEDIIQDSSKAVKFMKKIPLLWKIVDTFTDKKEEMMFELKDNREKLESIFKNYDICQSSLSLNIKAYKDMEADLRQYIDKIGLYIEYIQLKLEGFKEKKELAKNDEEIAKYTSFIQQTEFFINNMKSLESILNLSMKRITESVKNSTQLSISMSTGKPVFKLLINLAVSESALQKGNEAAIKAIRGMGDTIEKMDNELTDRSIDASNKTQEILLSPIISSENIIENTKKLTKHLEEINAQKDKHIEEAKKGNAELDIELAKLRSLNSLKQSDIEDIYKK